MVGRKLYSVALGLRGTLRKVETVGCPGVGTAANDVRTTR